MLSPPDEYLNQFTTVFAGGVTLTVAVLPIPHKVVCIAVGATGTANIMAVTAVLGLSQVTPFEVNAAETYRVVFTVIPKTVAYEDDGVPPVSAKYQLSTLPADEVADKTTFVPLQPMLEVVLKTLGVVKTVATNAVRAEVPLQLVASA